jgi:hypothetical protein
MIKLILDKDCDLIYEYLKTNTSGTYSKENIRPWVEGNNVSLKDVEDKKIYSLIINYITKLSIVTSLKYKEIIYPTFTDLVLWNKTKSMPTHVDDKIQGFEHRYITTVTYLNDNFTGGKTFVNNQEYQPKKGHTLIFKSKDPHGVTKITSGQRGILAAWFTKDFEYFSLYDK